MAINSVLTTVDESAVPPTEALLESGSDMEHALSTIAQRDETVGSADEIVGERIAERIAPDVETAVSIPGIES